VLAAMLAAGCGKSEEQKAAEKAAEEAREAADALKKAAEQTAGAATAQGMQEFAKAIEGVAGALSGASPDGTAAAPISFKELQTALPEVSGWTRETPTGERMTSPVAFSQTEVTYTQGEANVDVKIVDTAFSQLMFAGWTAFLVQGYERETQDGYQKSVTVGGHPGWEEWNSSSKNGELNLVVAKRFMVTVAGNNISDTKVLHEFASKIDAGRLASLK
jgi:hypothetical protein